MNRHRRRPLRLHLKARPVAKLEYRQPPKRSLKVIVAGIVVALVAIGALGFTAFSVLKNVRLKHSEHTPVASATATTSAVVVGTQNPVIATTPRPVTIPAKPSPSIAVTTHVPATTPVPVTSPIPAISPVQQPTPVVSKDGAHEGKPPSEATRKTREQARRDAERKRAHLEEMYQKHLISSEAYKKGQDEYRDAMAKYHNRVGGEE
jgi:hypothetical protein